MNTTVETPRGGRASFLCIDCYKGLSNPPKGQVHVTLRQSQLDQIQGVPSSASLSVQYTGPDEESCDEMDELSKALDKFEKKGQSKYGRR